MTCVPLCNNSNVGSTGKGSVTDLLTDKDMKLMVQHSHPETSYILLSRQCTKMVRAVWLDCESDYPLSRQKGRMRCNGRANPDLWKCCKKCEHDATFLGYRKRERSGSERRNPQVQSCGEPVHIQRNCKKQASGCVSSATANPDPRTKEMARSQACGVRFLSRHRSAEI